MRMKARDKGSDGRTKREIEIETNDLRGKDLRKRQRSQARFTREKHGIDDDRENDDFDDFDDHRTNTMAIKGKSKEALRTLA